MKMNYSYRLSILVSGAFLMFQTAYAQSSYIGMNKTADYDYTTRTGIITLDSYVKGSSKIIRQAKTLDAILVLDYSGSMDKSYSPKSGTQNKYKEASVTTYTWTSLGGGTSTDTKKSIGNKTIGGVTRELFYYNASARSGMNNGRKWMFYESGGSRYYLQPSGVVRKAANTNNPSFDNWPLDTDGRVINPIERSDDVIWSEMSYSDKTISQRIHALKAGVFNFIDSIAVHNINNNEKHEMSIVQFNSLSWPKFDYGNASDRAKYVDSSSDIFLREMTWYKNNNSQDWNSGGCSVLMKFNPLNSDDRKQEAKNTLNTYQITGNTAGDGGLMLARLLNSARTAHSDTSKYAKTVLFFTDGQPNKGSGNTFDTDAANDALAEALLLKQAGFTIYTIYCEGSETSETVKQQTRSYVDYLSSNYPNASSMSSTGSPIGTKKYAKSASDDIVDIFSSIAGEVLASAGVQYGAETVMNDFINNTYFKLARTVDVDKPWESVNVYKVRCTGMTLPDSTRTFGTASSDTVRLYSSDGIVLSLSRAASDTERDQIAVWGFDYSGNWCGLDKSGKAHGWKLIVKVPFEFTGDNETVPSTVLTNSEGSGIYPAQRDSTTGEIKYDPSTGLPLYDDKPEEEYVSPQITFCRLEITRFRLDKGESAIYEVTHNGSFVARVSLNGDGAESVNKILYGLPGGTYTVTETGWNWAYNKDPAGGSITQPVDNPDSLEPVNFVFRGSHKTGTGPEDLHNHDEEYKVNIIDVSDL